VNVVCRIIIFLNLGCSLALADSTVFQSRDIFLKDNQSKFKTLSHQKLPDEKKVMVFIAPQCPWCSRALLSLSEFKKNHPNWVIEVYVMASIKEFIEFGHRQMISLPLDLEYRLDINGSLADGYGVKKTPTYIIMKGDNQKKVEGYVDLARLDFNGEL